MNRGQLLWVGRERKNDPEALLAARYLKRIQPYMKLDERVLKPQAGTNLSTTEIQRRESERLQRALGEDDELILCDQRGRAMSSEALAAFLGERRRTSPKRLVWLIGGAMGVDDRLRRRAGFVLSLSQMTLPHALARVVLLEQIYRALCIDANHPYHHQG